jgi:NAD(P)-dependent dehydrogenase (short-subunit alcohol dehydrogenase family)
MNDAPKTAIVTGASQGIGAGTVKRFVQRGFNVVANSRQVTQSTEIAASDHVALVDGHIGEPATAARILETALSRFKSIDVLVNNPIRGVTAAVPMITKGGLETITQHLAMEYAKDGIRVNAVAPGAVYTPLHRNTPQDVMESLSPMGRPSTVEDITDAVMYLTDAATVTGHILYVDGGAHFGRW